MKNVLAFDFGASSGRAMLGTYDGARIAVREVHRFSNDPVMVGDAYYWDVLRLVHEIKKGLAKAGQAGGFESVGIDTWGVDYGLLDAGGRLMGNLYHYRDARNAPAAREVLGQIPMEALYARTGIQFAPFNTLFQLRASRKAQPYLLENAAHLLMLPDLLNYFLCGEMAAEYTHASTSGLLDVRTGDWDWGLIDSLGLPRAIFTPVRPAGRVLGALAPAVCEEAGVPAAKVVSVASHDTASAVCAVPARGEGAAWVSCGTWSLLGTELPAPNTGAAALRCNFTNEGGYGGKIRFLKNIMGTWLIQQSRRHWNRAGMALSYDDLERAAREQKPYQTLVDVDDPVFSPPGDIPGRVKEYARRSGQPVPGSVGEVMQCIYGGIALKYRCALESLGAVTGRDYETLHLVGGGAQDALLCQMAADMCGVRVVAGPVEATVIGNVLVQLLALGAIESLERGRELVRASFPVKVYDPAGDREPQQIAYMQYKRQLGL